MTVYFPENHLFGLPVAADPVDFQISFTGSVGMEPEQPEQPLQQTSAFPAVQPSGNARVFEQLFAANPLPMWVYEETSLRFLEVNQAALEKYGYSREEFLTLTLWDIRPASQRKVLSAYFEQQGRLLEGPDAQLWLHCKKNGETLEVQTSGHRFLYHNTPARLVVVSDVTERNRIQRALEDSENRLRLIAENTINLIMSFDATYQPTYVSPSVQNILGYTAEEALNLTRYSYIHRGRPTHGQNAVKTAVEQQADQHILEYRIQHKDGHYLWCETAFKLVWHEGAFQGFITSSMDITRRVEDREKLLASLNTSTQLVRLAEELEQATEPEDVIHLALQHCTEVIRFDYGMFIQVSQHQYTIKEMLGLSGRQAQHLLDQYLRSTGPKLLQAFLSRTPVFFGADEALCHPAEVLPRPEAHELGILPINVDGQLYGFLVFGTFQEQIAFSENTLRILRAVRDRISHAFERNAYIEKLSSSREETLRAIGLVLEYRDYETKGHTDRVVQLSDKLGRQMGLTGADSGRPEVGGLPARHRENRHSRPHPAQTGQAHP